MSRLFPLGIVAICLLPTFASATTLPGHLDLTFGSEGKRIVGASLPAGSARGPATVLEGPGGALYVVGHVDRADATSAIAIARLSANGDIDIDSGFGTAGLVEYLPPGLEAAYAYGATFDAHDRLIVVGQAFAGVGHTMLCRFDADGGIDVSFGKPETPGCMVETLGTQDWARAVTVQECQAQDNCSEGYRIVTAGSYIDATGTRRGAVAAFENDGAGLQLTFGDQGRAVMHPAFIGFSSDFSSIAQNHVGELAAGGWLDLGDDRLASVSRFDIHGTMDPTFGQSGFSLTAVWFENYIRAEAKKVILGDDGTVLLAGYVQESAMGFRPMLEKFLPDGSRDPAFDGSLAASIDALYYPLCASPCDARFNDMTLHADGRILATGNIARGDQDDLDVSGKSNTFAMRLLPDGTPDPSFGSPGSGHDGLAIVDHGAVDGNSDDVGTSLLLQGDKVVIAGYARAADPNLDDDVWDNYDFALTRIGASDAFFSDGFED